MKLVIQNLLENRKSDVPLLERQYSIGRDMANDIVLDSAFVAKSQAVLSVNQDGETKLKSVGSAEVRVNDQVAQLETECALQPGDEISIGHYIITLQTGTAVYELSEEEIARQEMLYEIEKHTHEQLVEKLDLRKFDPDSLQREAYEAKVDGILDELIKTNVAGADNLLLEFVTRIWLRDAVSEMHFRSNKATANRITRFAASSAPRLTGHLSKLVTSVYKQAIKELSSNGRHDSPSAEEVETWLNGQFEKIRYQIPTGLRAEVLTQYLKSNIMDTVFGLGPLEPLLRFDNISEIMVVHPALIYIEKEGVLQKSGKQFVSTAAAMSVIERIVSPLGLRVDRSTPLVDARLADGSRVNVVVPPLAVRGPSITIRKFSKIPLTMENLVEDKNALTWQVAEFLRACVVGRKNVVVSGGTGSGKTTLLNCLSEYIPSSERIVTIEDSAELQLKQEHVVTLESRPPNVEGKGAYTIRDLVKNALRMRPDRIIVGECRGAEALDMLQAMNTGHDGSMTTGHSNSTKDMISRLETMTLFAADMPIGAIRQQISSAIDLVVQISRFADGTRKITQVSEVATIDPDTGEIVLEDIYHYQYSEGKIGGVLRSTGYIPAFFGALMARGGVSLDLLFGNE